MRPPWILLFSDGIGISGLILKVKVFFLPEIESFKIVISMILSFVISSPVDSISKKTKGLLIFNKIKEFIDF